jgi:hypothetical protein
MRTLLRTLLSLVRRRCGVFLAGCRVGLLQPHRNDRYLVLTCRRVFAMILLVFLGFFYDCSSCLVRRITLLPEARASKRLFTCVQETSVALRLYGNGVHRNLTPLRSTAAVFSITRIRFQRSQVIPLVFVATSSRAKVFANLCISLLSPYIRSFILTHSF